MAFKAPKKILAALFFLLLTNCSNQQFPDNINPDFSNISSGLRSRDPVAMIYNANQKYVERDPELIKLKYKEMSDSRYAFYRATAYIFYTDIINEKDLETNIKIPLQGDLHLENMGTYLTADHKFAYDLNDFDDAFNGIYSWELARCAVSIRLAAADSGLSSEASDRLVKHFLDKYLFYLQNLLNNPSSLNSPLTQNLLTKFAAKAVEKATGTPHKEFLDELAPNGKFAFNEKIKPVSAEVRNNIIKSINPQLLKLNNQPDFSKIKDIAARIAGMASLGRYRYIVLVEGKSKNTSDDLIIEIKESSDPSASIIPSFNRTNNANRVISAYSYFLPAFSTHLGVTKIGENEFFLRELLPSEKVSLSKLKNESDFALHLETVALIAARANARAGKSREIIADLTKRANLPDNIAIFARKYFEQVNRDHLEFKKSIPSNN